MAIYSHINLIFTQDAQEAREIAHNMGSLNEPYWWIEKTPITPQTFLLILQTLQEIKCLLGNNGLSEFVSFSGYDFSEPYMGQAGMFYLHGFAF